MEYDRSTTIADQASGPVSISAVYAKFKSLVDKGMITADVLSGIVGRVDGSGRAMEEILLSQGIPKHELQRSISTYYGLPFREYDETLMSQDEILQQVDLEELKRELWFPLAVDRSSAEIVAWDPLDETLSAKIRETLKVDSLHTSVALPSDIIAFIENHQDVNPHFPPEAGRTPLAELRTLLASQRVVLSGCRTVLAKGRTGLAFMRTGICFISIGLVLLRIFGLGYLSIVLGALVVVGTVMAVDGLLWYLPARKIKRKRMFPVATEPTFGSTILRLAVTEDGSQVTRTAPIEGAKELRMRWRRLTPVMRRRFLAIDRTDLAEERTILAGYRTVMAQARTGLAFMRTGMAFLGLGIALLRQFHSGPWTWNIFDGGLIAMGVAMMLEGFHWYIPGRRASRVSAGAVLETQRRISIWDFIFPPLRSETAREDSPTALSISECRAPGIWGTTGLALERTLIAERRNVKSRLRTVMARSRTGLAFIRTGLGTMSVGLGLLIFFGFDYSLWTVLNIVLIAVGIALLTDGLYWHLPADKIRKQFPYCFHDMEIVFPDYARPSRFWQKVRFSHEKS